MVKVKSIWIVVHASNYEIISFKMIISGHQYQRFSTIFVSTNLALNSSTYSCTQFHLNSILVFFLLHLPIICLDHTVWGCYVVDSWNSHTWRLKTTQSPYGAFKGVAIFGYFKDTKEWMEDRAGDTTYKTTNTQQTITRRKIIVCEHRFIHFQMLTRLCLKAMLKVHRYRKYITQTTGRASVDKKLCIFSMCPYYIYQQRSHSLRGVMINATA